MLGVITKGLFNNTPLGFIMPGTFSDNPGYTTETPTGMSGAFASGNAVSLNEFFGGGGPTNTPVTEQVMANLQSNGWTMAIQLVTIPFVFRMGKRLAAPAINQTNRLLRNAGVGNTVKL